MQCWRGEKKRLAVVSKGNKPVHSRKGPKKGRWAASNDHVVVNQAGGRFFFKKKTFPVNTVFSPRVGLLPLFFEGRRASSVRMGDEWRVASAAAHLLLPREAPGKLGTMAANVADRGVRTEGRPAATRSAFADGPGTLIGEFITMEALRGMPVLDAALTELKRYFTDANAVLRAKFGGDLPEEVERAPEVGLWDVEQHLGKIMVPGHDLSGAVPLTEFSTVGRSGHLDRVIGLIDAMEGAFRESARRCEHDLEEAQRNLTELHTDLVSAQRNNAEAEKALHDIRTQASRLVANPSAPATTAPELPDVLAAAAAAAAEANATAASEIEDAKNQAKQLDEELERARLEAEKAKTPAFPEQKDAMITDWEGKASELYKQGEGWSTDVFSLEGVFPGPYNGLQVLRAPGGRDFTADNIKEFTNYILRRTQAYAAQRDKSDAVLELSRKSGKAWRAFHKFKVTMPGSAPRGGFPAWWKADGDMHILLSRELMAVEYRIHFAIVNGEDNLRGENGKPSTADLPQVLTDALNWPSKFAERIGAEEAAKATFVKARDAAQTAYDAGDESVLAA